MSKNLKPLPWPEELSPQSKHVYDVLNGGEDLPCAIVGAAFVDHCLAALLQRVLAARATSVGWLQPGRPLGEYATRRMLCYSLGLIDKAAGEDLDAIGAIRNRFAHRFFEVSFADAEIAKFCGRLKAFGAIEQINKVWNPPGSMSP